MHYKKRTTYLLDDFFSITFVPQVQHHICLLGVWLGIWPLWLCTFLERLQLTPLVTD